MEVKSEQQTISGGVSFSFSGDINTGIYSPLAENISLSTAGVERVNVNAVGTVKLDKYTTDGFVKEL